MPVYGLTFTLTHSQDFLSRILLVGRVSYVLLPANDLCKPADRGIVQVRSSKDAQYTLGMMDREKDQGGWRESHDPRVK